MRIYMDVCCINRPFDDQTDERIRLESEAVLSILKRCLFEWTLISSEAIDYEISKTPDVERRRKAERIMSISREKIIVDETIAARALEIERFGLRAIDALHISIAERSADVLLTTDDEIIRAAINKSKNFNIRIMNPVRWLLDVL
jgi:hypothetical protein